MNPSLSVHDLPYLVCLVSFAATVVCLLAGMIGRLSVRVRQRFTQLAFSIALTAVVAVSLATVATT